MPAQTNEVLKDSAAVAPDLATGTGYRAHFAKMAQTSPAIIVIFGRPNLQAVYFNDQARHRLDPQRLSETGSIGFADILGIGCVEKLQNEILPQTYVLGKWSGECELRDVWGSELHVRAVISLAGHDLDRGDSFLCLQAVECPDVASKGAMTSDSDLLQALLDGIPDAIYFKDMHSRFLRVSRALAKEDGLDDPSALVGKTDFDRFDIEHSQPAYDAEQKIIRTGEPLINEIEKLVWTDGRIKWSTTTKLPLRDRDGRIIGTFGISRDITSQVRAETERRELETKLQLAQKLESIGRLAAGVAHEINTPSQFITDNTHFLRDAFKQLGKVVECYEALEKALASGADPTPSLEKIQRIKHEIEFNYLQTEIPKTLQETLEGLARVTGIVRSLKEFSHPNSPGKAPADLNRTIETALTVCRHEWKYVADVVTEFEVDLPHVPLIVDEFNQVMLNLIINSAHAIKEANRGTTNKGKIHIRTRSLPEAVVIEVEDTGNGIPTEIQSRVFEPFFTTKPVGQGTGQGLAIVQSVIVKDHGGQINFSSEPGVGTTFHIKLPLDPQTTTISQK